ncbi:MAG: hypothetical protein WCO58_02645 [bacterium]
MNIYGKLEEIIHTANTLFPEFLKENKQVLGDRKGVYLLAVSRNEWKTVGAVLGDFEDPLKILEKTAFATEKACRLEKNYKHFTSFHTQNYTKKQFGGAISLPEIILSCSGFPAIQDHYFCLSVLKKVGLCSEKEEQRIQKEFECYKNFGTSY